jgi:TonB family protein
MLLHFVLFLAVSLSTPLPFRTAQAASAEPGSADGPVLVRLAGPVYPPIARAARVSGEVLVVVQIRADGSIASVRVASGPPMLHQAAIESASHSTFTCSGCTEANHDYSVAYSFKVVDEGDCCEGYSTPSSFEHLPETPAERTTHVLVTAPQTCLCDPAATKTRTKARSVRCLWLWKCSVRTD